MEIEFADPAVGELCNNYNPDDKNDGLRKYVKTKSRGERSVEEVMHSLDALRNAKDPSEILSMYDYHLLKYDKSGYAAISIISRGNGKKGGKGRWRILLKPVSTCGDINKESSINKVIIINLIEDYHKKKR